MEKGRNMSKLTQLVIGIGLMAVVTIVTIKWQGHPPTPSKTATQSTSTTPPSVKPDSEVSAVAASASGPAQENHAVAESVAEPTEAAVMAGPPSMLIPAPSMTRTSVPPSFSAEVRTLVSPQASYTQKQAAWKQLRDSGQLDQAIGQLEQAVKNDPSAAEYSAQLGWAYLQKLATTQDIRQQAILAMQADQTFDGALKLDPNNWDARYCKASALTHWPAELNKSQEVMENLSTLIDQQEARPPQPEYAQSYVLLGEQYLKAGYPDNAKEMWQRGAALFPQNEVLQKKLAPAP
jgi:hypothetical protein